MPAVHQVGCAGRIVSFEETPDGRYQLILSGLIRFRIDEERPHGQGRLSARRAELPALRP